MGVLASEMMDDLGCSSGRIGSARPDAAPLLSYDFSMPHIFF